MRYLITATDDEGRSYLASDVDLSAPLSGLTQMQRHELYRGPAVPPRQPAQSVGKDLDAGPPVGEATWKHSLRALVPGGTIVCSGATSGFAPSADLAQVFFLQKNVVGSTMGTLDELRDLLDFVATTGIEPAIGQRLPMSDAEQGFRSMLDGDTAGKIVFTR